MNWLITCSAIEIWMAACNAVFPLQQALKGKCVAGPSFPPQSFHLWVGFTKTTPFRNVSIKLQAHFLSPYFYNNLDLKSWEIWDRLVARPVPPDNHLWLLGRVSQATRLSEIVTVQYKLEKPVFSGGLSNQIFLKIGLLQAMLYQARSTSALLFPFYLFCHRNRNPKKWQRCRIHYMMDTNCVWQTLLTIIGSVGSDRPHYGSVWFPPRCAIFLQNMQRSLLDADVNNGFEGEFPPNVWGCSTKTERWHRNIVM